MSYAWVHGFMIGCAIMWLYKTHQNMRRTNAQRPHGVDNKNTHPNKGDL